MAVADATCVLAAPMPTMLAKISQPQPPDQKLRITPMPRHNGPALKGLPVNFHITRACNFSCGHCFATFQDVSKTTTASNEKLHSQVISHLAGLGASKITFSGGEPLLVKWLPALLRQARNLGVTTCVVTNGSLVNESWLSAVAADLDWLTLSVDSVRPETNLRIGRVTRQELSSPATQRAKALDLIAPVAGSLGIGLKINTVVTRHNREESLADFITKVRPVRWKIMQAMTVHGQDQSPTNKWNVSDNEFIKFIDRHRDKVPADIAIVPEPINLIRGSYFMVDPWGRIFESSLGRHQYLELVEHASLSTIEGAVSRDKLIARGGIWHWVRDAAKTSLYSSRP